MSIKTRIALVLTIVGIFGFAFGKAYPAGYAVGIILYTIAFLLVMRP